MFFRYIIVGEKNLFDGLVLSTRYWPKFYQDRVSLEFRPVWYPKHRENMKENFRICATERLFLPLILPEEDAVIYLDSDMIWMVPPSKLWKKFLQFNSDHVTAIGPNLAYYNSPENTVRSSA